MLQGKGKARGIIRGNQGFRVRLKNGLSRTNKKTDLNADRATPLYTSIDTRFIP